MLVYVHRDHKDCEAQHGDLDSGKQGSECVSVIIAVTVKDCGA